MFNGILYDIGQIIRLTVRKSKGVKIRKPAIDELKNILIPVEENTAGQKNDRKANSQNTAIYYKFETVEDLNCFYGDQMKDSYDFLNYVFALLQNAQEDLSVQSTTLAIINSSVQWIVLSLFVILPLIFSPQTNFSTLQLFMIFTLAAIIGLIKQFIKVKLLNYIVRKCSFAICDEFLSFSMLSDWYNTKKSKM